MTDRIEIAICSHAGGLRMCTDVTASRPSFLSDAFELEASMIASIGVKSMPGETAEVDVPSTLNASAVLILRPTPL